MITQISNKLSYYNRKKILIHIIISLLILSIGILFYFALSFLKKENSISNVKENVISVKLLQIKSKNYITNIIGYGTVKPSQSITLSSELGGKITFKNPNLKIGKIISIGELLVNINKTDHIINLCTTKLKVYQCQNFIKKLKKEQKIDLYRINNLEKNKLITYFDFKRAKKLLEKHGIGSKSELNKIEKFYNLSCDYLNQSLKTIYLYPIKLAEKKNDLKIVKIKLIQNKSYLKKCSIKNPFSSRVKYSYIEQGEIITPGQKIVILDNNNSLEIEVSIDLNDIKKWIPFESNKFKEMPFLFPKKVKPVPCKIICKESDFTDNYIGYIDYIKNFNEKTRTIGIVIKISKSKLPSINIKKFPLLNGMFCEINIPGKVIKTVFKLPRRVVNSRNEIYISDKNNRLKTIPINVIKKGENYLFIQNKSGSDFLESVIITRLNDPLEGSLLNIDEALQEKTSQ